MSTKHARSSAPKFRSRRISNDVVRNPDIDIVVELMGGYEPAYSLALDAIAHGKHVVTANKALLARHGNELFDAARTHGVMLAFEAAVAGGIPIIKALREGLTANRIEWIAGIINGTSNFILSEMRSRGTHVRCGAEGSAAARLCRGRSDVRHRGHRRGAQAGDPVVDRLRRADQHRRGVHRRHRASWQRKTSSTPSSSGYRIKLLAITKRTSAGIELRVHPTLVPLQRLIANVEGAMNAVLIKGDAVGTTLYYGQGAGSEPTASAVIADLVDVTRLHTADPENHVPHLAFQPEGVAALPWLSVDDTVTSYYFRMRVADQPGVLADITRNLADGRISIDALFQREPSEGENQTDIIMLTHDAVERDVNAAIARIEALPTVLAPVIRVRQEELL